MSYGISTQIMIISAPIQIILRKKKEDTWVVTINISQGRQIQHNDNQSSTPQLILAQDQNKVEQTPHLFMLTMHAGLETPCLLQP